MISIFNSKITEIEDITKDIKILRLSVPKNFEFKAGQYLSLSVFDEKGRKIRRPLSIANVPWDNYVEFCVKLIKGGLASEFIRKAKKGDEVELFGPAGKFILDSEGKDKDKDLFFIAAGVGIAPFAGMIKDTLNKGNKNKIILTKSSRTEEDSLYDNLFEKLSNKHKNFEFHNVFSRPLGKSENKGYVQDFLEKYLPENFDGNFYVCGLQEMINSVGDRLVELGFNEEQIFYEKFD